MKKFSIQSDAVRFELFRKAHRADSHFGITSLPFPQKLTGIVSLMFELMLSGLMESQRKPDRDTLDSLLKETLGKLPVQRKRKGHCWLWEGRFLMHYKKRTKRSFYGFYTFSL